jgi:hypothetical protein
VRSLVLQTRPHRDRAAATAMRETGPLAIGAARKVLLARMLGKERASRVLYISPHRERQYCMSRKIGYVNRGREGWQRVHHSVSVTIGSYPPVTRHA